MNCKPFDLAVITRGTYKGREVFIFAETNAPHVHQTGLPSWYVEIQGEPIPCRAPDGTKVPTLNCHVPDEWLMPVESFSDEFPE